MNTVPFDLYERIRLEMIARGLNQAQAAEQLGISAQHMSDILHKRRTISVELALKMEKALGIHAEYILHGQLQDQIDAARLEGSKRL